MPFIAQIFADAAQNGPMLAPRAAEAMERAVAAIQQGQTVVRRGGVARADPYFSFLVSL